MEYKRNYANEFELEALCWAAKKNGSSYGKLCAGLTRPKKEQILDEYRLYLRKQRQQRGNRSNDQRTCPYPS